MAIAFKTLKASGAVVWVLTRFTAKVAVKAFLLLLLFMFAFGAAMSGRQ